MSKWYESDQARSNYICNDTGSLMLHFIQSMRAYYHFTLVAFNLEVESLKDKSTETDSNSSGFSFISIHECNYM